MWRAKKRHLWATISARLKYANALIGSASGTGRVTVGDAWEAPIPDLEVAGKSDQFTTTGAQLFDASKIPVLTAGGATVVGTADGGYRISGSGDLTSSFYETVKITDISMLKPGNIMLKSEATVPKLSIKLINSSSATLLELSENQTKTITEDMLNTEGVYLQYMLYGPSSRTITPGTYYPMLYQDDDGTWEPYTGGQPSPSPDYPQPIISTGTVTTGVQLFDAGKVLNKSFGGATIVNNADGSITISGSGTMTDTLDTRCTLTHEETMTLIGNERTFTVTANITTYPYFFFNFIDKTGAVLRAELVNDATSITRTIPTTLDIDTLYIQFGYYGRVDTSIVSGTQKVMVNAGSTPEPWEPYTGGKPSPSPEYPQPLEVTVTGAQLMDTSKMARTHNDVVFSVREDGSILVTGNTLEKLAHSIVVSINLSPGTYYVSGSVPIADTKIFVKAKKWYSDGKSNVINDTAFTVDGTETKIEYFIYIYQGLSDINEIVYPMLNAGPTALPYQPYQSKAATIPLTAPLYGIGEYRDRIMCKDGVWGIERQFIPLTFDGSEDEGWGNMTTNTSEKMRLTPNGIFGLKPTNNLIASPGLSNLFGVFIPAGNAGTFGTKQGVSIDHKGGLVLYCEKYNTVNSLSAWKEFLQSNNLLVVALLDAPTWEPLPAATQSALNALTTFTGTNHITITAGGPEPDVAVEYVQDTKAVIADLQAQIDEIRNGGTA